MEEKLTDILQYVAEYTENLSDEDFQILCDNLKAKREELKQEQIDSIRDDIGHQLEDDFNDFFNQCDKSFPIKIYIPSGKYCHSYTIDYAHYNTSERTLVLTSSL